MTDLVMAVKLFLIIAKYFSEVLLFAFNLLKNGVVILANRNMTSR